MCQDDAVRCISSRYGRVNVLGCTCFLFPAHFGRTHAYADREDKWVLARSANRGARWAAGGKERETEKNEHTLLKSLEWRHAESAIILFGIIYRRAVLTRKSQSSRTIYLFFTFSETAAKLFATIQLLRIYRRHKLRAPFIWSSKADNSDLSGAPYACPADLTAGTGSTRLKWYLAQLQQSMKLLIWFDVPSFFQILKNIGKSLLRFYIIIQYTQSAFESKLLYSEGLFPLAYSAYTPVAYQTGSTGLYEGACLSLTHLVVRLFHTNIGLHVRFCHILGCENSSLDTQV